MEARNLLKRVSITIIALAFPVLIGVTVFQHRQIRRLTSALEQSSHTNQAATDSNSDWKDTSYHLQAANQEVPAEGDDVDALAYQLQAAEEELDMAHEELNEELDRKAELARQRMEAQKKQLQSPSFKKYVREDIESRLAKFVEAFDISPEDAEAFAEILFDQQMALTEFYMEANAITHPTDADREKFSRLNQDLISEYDEKAKELLGETVYQEYENYDRRKSMEDYTIDSFAAALDPETGLTDTQKEALVDALLEADEKSFQDSAGEKVTYSFPSEQYTPEKMDQRVDYITRRNESILESAASILSDDQMEQLRTYLNQDLERIIENMKMNALKNGYSYNIDDATDTSANP